MKDEFKINEIQVINSINPKTKKDIITFLRSDNYVNNYILKNKIENKFIINPDMYLAIRIKDIYYLLEKNSIENFETFIKEIQRKRKR